ncbi:MAG: hypothetical protein H6748_03255 [Spirochaetaceae bacterium]|nr:hypothetical protein [Spirochaetaceae bacterium]
MRTALRQALPILLLGVAALAPALQARADHHSWRFEELFSTPDGSVQFIEMRATTDGHDQLQGHTITSGGNVFTFPSNLPDAATAGRRLLIATAAFAALAGAPTPDFLMSEDFFGASGTPIVYAGGLDSGSLPSFPNDGVTSVNRTPPTLQANSPTNFAGVTGSIQAPACGNGLIDPGEECDRSAGSDPLCCSIACVASASGASCSDGNVCTVGDACDGAGSCVVGPPSPGMACSDGDPCTLADVCDAAGVCVGGSLLVCDDANDCTADSCLPAGGCSFAPVLDGAPCDDADVCTPASSCASGVCVGSGSIDCDDANGCTDDGCDPQLGCRSTPNTAPCDDGDACTTGDVCALGSCVGAPRDCSDGNPCTNDLCDPGLGCQNPPNAVLCDDGDPCTSGDVCSAGACLAGAPADCDDGDACTADSCDAQTGCRNEPIPGCSPPAVPFSSTGGRFLLLALLVVLGALPELRRTRSIRA